MLSKNEYRRKRRTYRWYRACSVLLGVLVASFGWHFLWEHGLLVYVLVSVAALFLGSWILTIVFRQPFRPWHWNQRFEPDRDPDAPVPSRRGLL